MKTSLEKLPIPFSPSPFEVMNLTVNSKSLKNNPLGNPTERCNYVLRPKSQGLFPVVFHLSGYFGSGPQSFNLKTLEESFPELIAKETLKKTIPMAIHVFVDAMTSFGGSQFINSRGCGLYGDYLQKDLWSAVVKTLPIREDKNFFAMLGSSSGGYGALAHFVDLKSRFGIAMAIAPDSFFEVSLLNEYYKVSEFLKEIPTVTVLRQKLTDPRFRDSKNFFSILNSIAMSLCYSDGPSPKIHYPINLQTGELCEKEFKLWKKKDPVEFFKKLQKIPKDSHLYLSVGRFDEYSLQFGARSIHEILKKKKIKHHYSEFDGGHYKSTQRKLEALMWLRTIWK